MGSNSSAVQSQIVQQIETKLDAHGDINQSVYCTLRNVEFIGPCRPDFRIYCYNKADITSQLVLTESVDAVQNILQNQKSQSGMFRFLNLNSASSKTEIEQVLKTNLSNKCTINQSTFSEINGLRIIITKKFCALPVRIYQMAGNEGNCTLYTVANIFANAEANVEVDQTAGGFGCNGSCNDSNMAYVFLGFIIFFLIAAAIFIFFFRNKRKNQLSQTDRKSKSKSQRYSQSKIAHSI